jgi:hypothetical protein
MYLTGKLGTLLRQKINFYPENNPLLSYGSIRKAVCPERYFLKRQNSFECEKCDLEKCIVCEDFKSNRTCLKVKKRILNSVDDYREIEFGTFN